MIVVAPITNDPDRMGALSKTALRTLDTSILMAVAKPLSTLSAYFVTAATKTPPPENKATCSHTKG